MPKKNKSKTLQTCNCCNFEATNIWNHILNSYECKQYCHDNCQFHIPHLNIPVLSNEKLSKQEKIHNQNENQPSSTHTMFGEYVSLKSIAPIINNIDTYGDAFDFGICSDDDIDS